MDLCQQACGGGDPIAGLTCANVCPVYWGPSWGFCVVPPANQSPWSWPEISLGAGAWAPVLGQAAGLGPAP